MSKARRQVAAWPIHERGRLGHLPSTSRSLFAFLRWLISASLIAVAACGTRTPKPSLDHADAQQTLGPSATDAGSAVSLVTVGSMEDEMAAAEAAERRAAERENQLTPPLPFPESAITSLHEEEGWQLSHAHVDVDIDPRKLLALDPSAPVVGDLVSIWFRQPGYEDRCRFLRALGGRDDQGVENIILTLAPSSERCGLEPTLDFGWDAAAPPPFGRRIRLGKLPEGRYRVVAGSHALTFDVKPAGTPPGPFPLVAWVALVATRTFQIHNRDPGVIPMPGLYDHSQESPITARRLTELWPDLPSDSRFLLFQDARALTPEPIAGGYRITLPLRDTPLYAALPQRVLELRVRDEQESRTLTSFRWLRVRSDSSVRQPPAAPSLVPEPCPAKVSLRIDDQRGTAVSDEAREHLQRWACACYRDALAREPALTGALDMTLSISASGAKRVNTRAPAVSLRSLASCVERPLRNYGIERVPHATQGSAHVQLRFSNECHEGWSTVVDACL